MTTAAPERVNDEIRYLRVADGTDLTSPAVQREWSARIQASPRFGPTWIPMWPRQADGTDGISPAPLPIVNTRPHATTIYAPPGFKGTPGEIDAWARRAFYERGSLVEIAVAPDGRPCGTFAVLGAAARQARIDIAGVFGVPRYRLDIAVLSVADESTGLARIDQIVVVAKRDGENKVFSLAADKRMILAKQALTLVAHNVSGWQILDDPVAKTITFRYGAPRVLPKSVDLEVILPPGVDSSNWSRLPLGLAPSGAEACVDLTAGPHLLVVGPTGSGKSVLLRAHSAGALAHGHQLAIIDPIKGGLDFAAFKPFAVVFADDSIGQARAAIEAIYAEGMRRKAILRAYECPSWADLPASVRRSERITPLTVLFDEFMSAVIASPVPKGLDKDDPLVVEANQMNADKAVILALVGKIARECRFVGIHLAIAMQRPDASLLTGFGEIRSNLSSAIQLVKPGSLPAQETLRMVFPGDQTQRAADTIMELDDGRSKGLATIAAEGGEVVGFRVAFGVPSEIPAMLERLAVPRVTPWEIKAEEREVEGEVIGRASAVAPTAPVWGAEPEQIEVDLGDLEFSLDDLGVGSGEGATETTPPFDWGDGGATESASEPDWDWHPEGEDEPVLGPAAVQDDDDDDWLGDPAPSTRLRLRGDDDEDPFADPPHPPRIIRTEQDEDPFGFGA